MIKSKNLFAVAFKDLNSIDQDVAGGKGGNLALLFQAGFPVPNGFIIKPNAFDNDELISKAWLEIKRHLTNLRKKNPDSQFVVRSSALMEDSLRASFAGEFETVLGNRTDDEIHKAIHVVRASRLKDRVKVYSKEKGLMDTHEMAVIVQQQVPADISGVLFSADPVTGNRMIMVGNYVTGYGEHLVSGERDAEKFIIERPKGRYNGPSSLKKHSKKLYKLAIRAEKVFAFPQDIEFCISGGKLFLLQSRSVSTLVGYDPVKGLWNASLIGDYLWSNVNMSEATPEVMTPSTWSFSEILLIEAETFVSDAECPVAGNICGRPYVNLSYFASSFGSLGMNFEKSLGQFEDTMGRMPELPRVPLFPYRLRTFIRHVPANIWLEFFGKKFIRKRYEFVASTPEKCQEIKERISTASTNDELISLYNEEIYPYFLHSCWTLRFIMKSAIPPTTKLRTKLLKLVGEEDANTLLSNLSGIEGQLASLGPLLGLSKVDEGELSPTQYMDKYGHRSSHETELSIPRPYEDPNWLNEKLEEYRKTPIKVKELLHRRHDKFKVAWEKLTKKHPKKANKIKKQITHVTQATIDREDVRSEYIRFWGIIREFLLKVAQLTNLGEGIFFLTKEEVLEVLKGNEFVRAFIPTRKDTYERYKELPPYPAFIIGRFDPLEWAKSPARRSDLYDSQGTSAISIDERADVVKGSAASMGRVEGYVRLLNSPDEGYLLQPGEILVTTTTNIGWSLLFPKAAGIVTDVGAILSHAAIVARELGIPAVVGCGDATMRLKTGNKVLVDGGRGIVEIKKPTNEDC
ncbi:MAG: PEP/pyruvate-binding domain-containing protein [Candidatus Thorarchaeota archaeon]